MKVEQFTMLHVYLSDNYNLNELEVQRICDFVNILFKSYKALEEMEKKMYYIYDPKRRKLWRESKMGYTYHPAGAGKYTYEEAKKICTAPNVAEMSFPVEHLDGIGVEDIANGLPTEYAIFTKTNNNDKNR